MADTGAFAAKLQRQLYQFLKNYELCEQLCASQFKVTVAQGYALMSLPREGSVSMNELSQAMGLASSTMTRMVDQLVGKALASRAPDPEDRRVVRVGPTALGQELRADLEKAQQDFLVAAVEDIQEDERSTVLHALDRITSAIVKGLKCCSPR